MVLDKQRRTFLSYSRANKDFALKLARELKSEGFFLWLDQLDIPAGSRWDREVEKALKECEIFMIILTPASINSENVLDEIGYAIDNGKRILPVLLENCEVPLRLRRIQYVDFTTKSFEEGVQAAKELLQNLIAQLPPPREKLDNVSLGQASDTESKVLEVEGAPERTVATTLIGVIFDEIKEQLEPYVSAFKKLTVYEVMPKISGTSLAGLIFVLVSVAYSLLTNHESKNLPIPTSPPTPAIVGPTSNTSASVVSTTLPTSVPGSTVTLAPTPVPVLGIGSSRVSYKDGMTLLYVPEGEFIMGSDDNKSKDAPVHTVTLDAFWIDQTEVTIAMYAKCVQADACEPPAYDPKNYFYAGDARYDNYPVIFVNWSMASAYCTWVGRRLPTEAEWEKAARGVNRFTYPWGDDEPSVIMLNYLSNNEGSPMSVGTYPDGASPYGTLDMAGNVWEWVADFYGWDYYTHSPVSNPQGPTEGTDRIVRGGSFASNADGVKVSRRLLEDPSHTYSGVGFRCAFTS